MSKHSKRYVAHTEKWGIPTKQDFWAPKAKPGPHKAKDSVPLVVLVRDILQYAESSREAAAIIGEKKILVDGKKVKDKNIPVGFMDVVSIPSLDEHYRVLFDQRGKVRLGPVAENMENWKLCRIEDKSVINGGKIQLNLHDGRNLLVEDGSKYNTKDVLKIEIPSQKIIESYEFEERNMALITGGKHIGELATIKEYEVIRGPQKNIVHFDNDISTTEDYVFIIGKEKPIIKIPEVGII